MSLASITVSLRHLCLMNAIKSFDDLLIGENSRTCRHTGPHGIPRWATEEYIKQQTQIAERRSIFSDKEGLWQNLPNEVLMIIMAYHSRDEKQYWASISFNQPDKWYLDYNYNPYKNVIIYQPAFKFRLKCNHYGGMSGAERQELLALQEKHGKKEYEETAYGKQRRFKRLLNGSFRGAEEILHTKHQEKNGICEKNGEYMKPSKLKCKYITDTVYSGSQNEQLQYIATDGITEAERKKNIRIAYISVSAGYFHPKIGKAKGYTMMKVKRKFRKNVIDSYVSYFCKTIAEIENRYPINEAVAQRKLIKLY